jgi:IclR family acetate operon transcriptional repressor
MLLANFTPEHPEWTTTEISRACDLPVPTCHRILAALQTHGYVVRDVTTKRFRLGPTARALGRSSQVSPDLRSASLPIMQSIASQTGETVVLTVPSEDRVNATCIERVESSQPLRLSVAPGRSVPLHAGAQQKAILAFLPDEDQEGILKAPLEKLCKSTITDPEKLRAELKGIRQRGWARSFEETNLGTWGLAMTLLDGHGHAAASIGVAGPQVRLNRNLMVEWVELLGSGITELADKLDLLPSRPRSPGQGVGATVRRLHGS